MDKHIEFQGQEYLFVYDRPESTWTFPDHGDYTCKLDSGYRIVIMCKAYVGWFWVIYDKDWNTVANGSDGGWYDSDKRYYEGEEIEQCAKSALSYCMIKSLASSKKSATRTFTYAEQKELEDEVIDKPWLNNADRLKDPDILLSF